MNKDIAKILAKYHLTPNQHALLLSIIVSWVQGKDVILPARPMGQKTVLKACEEISQLIKNRNHDTR